MIKNSRHKLEVSVVWLPEKSTQKNLPTFFPVIFYEKTKLNSLQKLRKINTFKAHKHSSLNASNIEYFGTFVSKWRRKGRECGYRYIIYTVTLKNGTPKKHLDVVLLNGS